MNADAFWVIMFSWCWCMNSVSTGCLADSLRSLALGWLSLWLIKVTLSCPEGAPDSRTFTVLCSSKLVMFWQQFGWVTVCRGLMDSDWILRTLSLSSREFERSQSSRININPSYQSGQQHSTSQPYQNGQKPVVAVVISISYINQFNPLSQWVTGV